MTQAAAQNKLCPVCSAPGTVPPADMQSMGVASNIISIIDQAPPTYRALVSVHIVSFKSHNP